MPMPTSSQQTKNSSFARVDNIKLVTTSKRHHTNIEKLEKELNKQSTKISLTNKNNHIVQNFPDTKIYKQEKGRTAQSLATWIRRG